ncbi:hypothetical protein N5J01_21515, partial [Stenotrophomonas sp. GD03701]|uniref:hypothetical protein n=1 Tax=Stenotrophomonas sp. GD03701 TaxID=2975369 RepID=UPI0024478595
PAADSSRMFSTHGEEKEDQKRSRAALARVEPSPCSASRADRKAAERGLGSTKGGLPGCFFF